MLDGMRQNAGSWIIKVLFLIIILAFVLAYGSGSLRQSGSGILAYVDETPILVKDFQRQYQMDMRRLQAQLPNISAEDMEGLGLKQATLAKMVNSVLVRRELDRLGLSVTDAELGAFIRSNPQFWNDDRSFDDRYYERAVRSQGMSPAAYEDAVRQSILQDKLVDYVGRAAVVHEQEARDLFLFGQERIKVDYLLFPWEDFKDGVTPTEAEIEAYYADNQDRFQRPAKASFTILEFTPRTLATGQTVTDEEVAEYYEANADEFTSPEMVRARHILIKTDASATGKAAEQGRLQLLKLKARIAKGESFAKLAEKHSEGPSNVRGGDLGFFPREAMVEPFEKAAFGLQPGEVSDPVRTEFGWHLIKVEERRQAGRKTLAEATPEIRSILAEEKAAVAMSDTLDLAIGRIIAGDALADVGEDLGINPRQVPSVPQSALVERLGIDKENADMLFSMAPGKPTEIPVDIEDGYLLAEKTSETPAAVAELAEVRDAIVQALKREGAMQLARERAMEALAAAADGELPADLAKRVKTSEPFQRSGMVAELGLNPTMAEDAFAARDDAWLPEPYAVGDGYAMVRQNERIVPGDERWAEVRDTVMQQLLQSRRQEMFQAFITQMRDQATVEVVDNKMLQ